MRTVAGLLGVRAGLDVALAAGAVVLTAVACLRWGPLVALIAALSPMLIHLLVQKSWFRVGLLVVGGLFILGSSADVSVSKVLYTGAVILIAAISALRLLHEPPAWLQLFFPLVPFGIAFVLILVFGVLLGPPTTGAVLARQAILYLYIPLAVIIGLDAGRDMHPGFVRFIVLIVGLISAIGFMTYWLDRRGASSLAIGGFVLYSMLLPALAFSLALVMLGTESGFLRRLPWLVAVVFIPVAMIVSGTRSNLLLLLAFAGVLGLQSAVRVRPAQAVAVVVVVALLIVTVFPIVAQYVVAKPGFIEERLNALLLVVTGRGGEDLSYQGRADQYVIAGDFIRDSPLLGEGIGYQIPVILDTPLITVVRIGFLGSFAVIAFLVASAVLVRKSAVRFGATRAHTAFWGFAVVFVASIPLGTPLEDRGFAYALLLAFTMLSSELALHARRTDPPPLGASGVVLSRRELRLIRHAAALPE